MKKVKVILLVVLSLLLCAELIFCAYMLQHEKQMINIETEFQDGSNETEVDITVEIGGTDFVETTGAESSDNPETETYETISSVDTEPTENGEEEIDTTEIEPTEEKPQGGKPTETKPTETKPTETKPTETKPAETKPLETESVETKPNDGSASDIPTDSGNAEYPGNNTGGDGNVGGEMFD